MEHRKKLINWLFEKSQKIYLRFKKKQPWNISNKELLEMPVHSFGFALGTFLNKNGFLLIPKVERHDCYHLLTGMSTTVEDEIALQYLCFGNGKRTPYLLGVLLLGTVLLPEYFKYYRKCFSIGKLCNSFHHYDFKTLLTVNFQDFKNLIFPETALMALQNLQKEYSEKQFSII